MRWFYVYNFRGLYSFALEDVTVAEKVRCGIGVGVDGRGGV